MKIGDWVIIVPYNPMIRDARPYIGSTYQIKDGPFSHPGGKEPNEHWDLGIRVNESRTTWWWVRHLMPIDPPEEVKNEETTDQEILA